MAPKSSKTNKSSKQAAKSAPDIDPNSSFTPESFEKELKALAAKAKEDTWAKHFQEQAGAYLKPAALLTLIAFYSNVSQLNLSPVYGGIPSSARHNEVVMAACFLGWASNLWLGRNLSVKPHLLLPLIALHIPAIQFYLFKLSGVLGGKWGPVATEVLTLFPLISLSVSCTANYLDYADLSSLPKWLADAAPGLGAYSFFKGMENVSGGLIQNYIGKSFFFTRMGLQLVLGASYSLFAPSKLLLYAIPALLHTAVLNTHVPTQFALSATNSVLGPLEWAVVDRRESLTGYISVVDSMKNGFRVMRCDHSLLGGEWTKFKDTELGSNQVAEPIYGVFAMLEAVRLVKVPKKVKDRDAKALVIGLGIGTTPAALVAHGIDTTVVEIDPVVHEFALKYFQLPSNHTPVIEDAVSYTQGLVDKSNVQFDYIIHDVFTGGAEPIELFTLEFLQNLHSLLKPNGVIAINYAGDFTLPPPRIVVNTIREIFPSCRIFREHPRDEEDMEKTERDFTNMVIFCTKLSGGISFREATARDQLNSPTRRHFLQPEHEVQDSDFVAKVDEKEIGVLRRNETDKLAKYHQQSALGHWYVMRNVLPKEVWEYW